MTCSCVCRTQRGFGRLKAALGQHLFQLEFSDICITPFRMRSRTRCWINVSAFDFARLTSRLERSIVSLVLRRRCNDRTGAMTQSRFACHDAVLQVILTPVCPLIPLNSRSAKRYTNPSSTCAVSSSAVSSSLSSCSLQQSSLQTPQKPRFRARKRSCRPEISNVEAVGAPGVSKI